MRYGFVIDQTRCIGCHACTVACKEENRVPLGTFRTWVKYVEKGEFPNTRRHFAVLRCNHCDNAPCVTICPTVALYRRPDGIVDFDRDRCIGCKSCMQACPYDALYIDPDTHTAAKCHFCAHRVERGLEPACVIVCPERAILTGDLDDPESEVSRVIAREQVTVRKPEQGTRPKLFYVGADHATLAPALQHAPAATLWGQRAEAAPSLTALAAAWRPAPPVAETAKAVAALGRTVYDVPHEPRPWGWRVSTYLWTKSIAAGAVLADVLGAILGWPGVGGVALPAVGLVFLLLTTFLLVVDLKRPERFLYVLTRPNPRSWLTRGAWILLAFAGALAVWVGAVWTVRLDVIGYLALPLVALALATAGYSAFLFAQAEGRDFWQSPLVLPHLLVSAITAGAAVGLLAYGTAPSAVLWRRTLLWSLGLNLLVVLAECWMPHASPDGAAAARQITRGPWRHAFLGGVVAVGTLIPAALLLTGSPVLAGLAAVLTLAGLLVWEDCWVKAGQSIPLS